MRRLLLNRPRRFGRAGRIIGGTRVEETAACARSLAAVIGGRPAAEMLPGGASQATRAALTGRLLERLDRVPWPNAISRQLDPDDPAFLPALGVHPVLAARDRTLLGLPGRQRVAWVDPRGWAGMGDGPAVAVWFGDASGAYTVGPRPNEVDAPAVLQRRSECGVGVRTRSRRGKLELVLMHWPVILDGRVCWALNARLTWHGRGPRPARLAFAVRPVGTEGASPVFTLDRTRDALWTADGVPTLALCQPGDELYVGRFGEPDPWRRFAGLAAPESGEPPDALRVQCSAGQASGLEVFHSVLQPGEMFTRFAVLVPPRGTPAALLRTSGASLWSSAQADRRGILAAGSEVVLEEHQAVLTSARLRLLVEPERVDLAAMIGTVALARLGFTRRAGERLGDWMGRVGRDGRFGLGGPEGAALLAWAAGEFVRWTGERAWMREHLANWQRLLDHLAGTSPEPGGAALIGPGGGRTWSAIWRAAGLLSSSTALRALGEEHSRWAIAGGRAREALPAQLGPGPWSASVGRAPDGSAAATLVAVWLGLVPASNPGAAATVAHLRKRWWHGGGVLLHGGAHVAATALLAAVEARVDPRFDALGVVARLASSSGALPTARHPRRGALGEGDDPLSAALFTMLALDRVQADHHRLVVRPGLRSALDLPTPYGRVDIQVDKDGQRRVIGRWRSEPPTVILLGDRPDEGSS